MRICRFNDNRLGVVVGEELVDCTEVLAAMPVLSWPLPPGDPLIRHLAHLRPLLETKAASGARLPLASVRLESPVATPSKIIAAPVNYAKHLAEAKADKGINFGVAPKTIEQYGLFLKAASALVGPSRGVTLPPTDRRIDEELELAIIVGREGKNIPRDKALQFVAGYAIALDMTLRGEEDRSWRKSYDSFAVLGPWLVTADELGDPGALDFSLSIAGQKRQAANTRDLIYDVARLIEYASSTYALYPGDVIMSGTPEGVGPVSAGDVMRCTFERIGVMEVAVR